MSPDLSIGTLSPMLAVLPFTSTITKNLATALEKLSAILESYASAQDLHAFLNKNVNTTSIKTKKLKLEISHC